MLRPLSYVRLTNMEMHPVYLFLDPYLIWFYRISGSRGGEFSHRHPQPGL